MDAQHRLHSARGIHLEDDPPPGDFFFLELRLVPLFPVVFQRSVSGRDGSCGNRNGRYGFYGNAHGCKELLGKARESFAESMNHVLYRLGGNGQDGVIWSLGAPPKGPAKRNHNNDTMQVENSQTETRA